MVIKGVFIILAYYALGNTLSGMSGNFIPGSVIGMLLLFISLAAKIVSPATIRPVAEFLTKNMTVFFIPASIGILDQWDLIKGSLIGWAGVVMISTIAVLVCSGVVQDSMLKAGKKIKKQDNGK